MFIWADSDGLPLEMIAERVVKAGLDLEWEIRIYVLQALKAGWKKDKIASELREAAVFGLVIPQGVLESLKDE